jgi:hypothetical protein
VGRKMAKTHHLGMAKGTIYYYKKFVHQKMKHCMLSIFITMWFINWIKEKKKKKVQFIFMFYLLREGCPLMDYESFKDFFAFSNSKTCPRSIGLIT